MTNNIYQEIAMVSIFNKFIEHTANKLYEASKTFKDSNIDKFDERPIRRGINRMFRKNILYLIGTYHNDEQFFLFPKRSAIFEHKKELFKSTLYVMADTSKIDNDICAEICAHLCESYKSELEEIAKHFDNDQVDIKQTTTKNKVILQYKSGKRDQQLELSKVSYDKLVRLSTCKEQVNDCIANLLTRYTCFDIDKEGIFFSADNVYKFIIDNKLEDDSLEAFSGSINSNLKNYCSLFTDIESKFGSKGSFFVQTMDQLSKYKLFVCNPPFVKILINHLFTKIMDILDTIKDVDLILIIPDHRSNEQLDMNSIHEVYIGPNTMNTKRYEGYNRTYDDIIKKYVKKIFVMYNYEYHNHFRDEYKKITTDTLIIYLSNKTNRNTIYNNFEDYIKS